MAGKRQAIDGSYLLKLDDQVGFQVAAYDTTKPLIIDPILVFSTYLGGSGDDFGKAIAVDSVGQISVTGQTHSADFPTMNPLQAALGGDWDAFVIKLTADGALAYATYFGGSNFDAGEGIALDSAGRVSVTGRTHSADFPTMNPLQPTLGGVSDAFVAQLTADGTALVYSTFLGGSGGLDSGEDIAVDSVGKVSVTGGTNSLDFPTKNPVQPALAGARDAFVAQLTSDGTALVYSTYLGGISEDFGKGIALDSAGQASVTGWTGSNDFPTQNPIQPVLRGGTGFEDAFVAQLSLDGAALNFSTYLGGSNFDGGEGIAVDSAGQILVTGQTDSTNFPTMNPLQAANGGARDAFVVRLTADGAALSYATYLGGGNSDEGFGIAVDSVGQATVTGGTYSTDFPMQNPLQAANGGGRDVFVTQLTADGKVLKFSSYLGGSSEDFGQGIAVDSTGQASVTGLTTSTDFPTVNAFQPNSGGSGDAFVAKIDTLRENVNDLLNLSGLDTAFSPVACDSAAAGTFTITATFTNISADTLSNLLISVDTLTGGNVLCNANGGPGGAGATLTVPLEGGLADGQLSPGESFVVELPVGLQTFNQFTFFVDVLGAVDGQ